MPNKNGLKFKISNLPKSPGVYEFRDKKGRILYIGKATSLRDRVRSYFRGTSDEGSTFGIPKVEPSFFDRPHIAPMISQVADIKVHKTDSVLEALILEANLIKKHQPKYNVEGKDDKSFAYVVITKEKFPKVLILRETNLYKVQNSKAFQGLDFPSRTLEKARYFSSLGPSKIYGPYISKKQLEIVLKLIRKIFPYHSAKQVSRNCCFEHQIGLCSGPHIGAISRKDYLKNIHGIEMILRGRKKNLITELKKQMKEYAKNNEFEKAAEVRNRIFALEHVQDVALISDEGSTFGIPKVEPSSRFRIEGYDISNIGGNYAVGSMVVFLGNKPDKSQYRKFKIKTVSGIDDVGMMREVLCRRFNNNWPKPDLILLDGGKGHLNMAQNVLKELKLDIPVAAIAKGPTRKISNFQFLFSGGVPKSKINKLKNIFDNKYLLVNIMSEAHRFAISYHKNLRRRNWGYEL